MCERWQTVSHGRKWLGNDVLMPSYEILTLNISSCLLSQPLFNYVSLQSQLRQEACKSLYKLCLGQPSKGSPYAVITLSALLELLPIAVNMEPLMNDAQDAPENRKGKLGASSQDYLWLTGQILDSMDEESVKQVGVINVIVFTDKLEH